MSAELAHLVGLAHLDDMGPTRLAAVLRDRSAVEAVQLLRRCDHRVLHAVFENCRGIDEAKLSTWATRLAQIDPHSVLRQHLDRGVAVDGGDTLATLEPWCSDPEPPRLLFRLGRAVRDSMPTVGIVGTRRCTAYGRAVAGQLGRDLARAGVVVVSGVAAGIDGAAQRAAADAGGHVVGVVAGGLDRPYPRVNEDLWHRLAETGTLLSEYPLGSDPKKWRFPARNRLIAALSDMVIVVESPEQGGSMYTVEAGLERDRPVGAVPGPVTAPTSVGPNKLLVEGAIPIRDVDDVLVVLGHERSTARRSTAEEAAHRVQWLLDALGYEAATIDELLLRTGATLPELTTGLGTLTAEGRVVETGGWYEQVPVVSSGA